MIYKIADEEEEIFLGGDSTYRRQNRSFSASTFAEVQSKQSVSIPQTAKPKSKLGDNPGKDKVRMPMDKFWN